jgi:prepilin-type N-terminal cleavage/methylation domain-containing protein
MKKGARFQKGFTLIEIAFVVLIVSIMLGATLTLISKQQEVRRYQEADREMDKIIETIIGFAQINGRLPCPAGVATAGAEFFNGFPTNCNNYGGFVPVNALGINGRLNAATLLLDPWGNPYRYYVSRTNSDWCPGGLNCATNFDADFVFAGQMQEIGLSDNWNWTDPDDPIPGSDGIMDLDGQFVICDAGSSSAVATICDPGVTTVFGNPVNPKGPYQGAIVVLLSLGKNGNQTPTGDELENRGGESAGQYFLKKDSFLLGQRSTIFVKRTTGFADDFDDIVKWISPSALFPKMIEAEQLP